MRATYLTNVVSRALLAVAISFTSSVYAADVLHPQTVPTALAAGTELPHQVFLPQIAGTRVEAEDASAPTAEIRVAAGGTTYYVDCAAGKDSNNGTSSGNAWKSVSKAN